MDILCGKEKAETGSLRRQNRKVKEYIYYTRRAEGCPRHGSKMCAHHRLRQYKDMFMDPSAFSNPHFCQFRAFYSSKAITSATNV